MNASEFVESTKDYKLVKISDLIYMGSNVIHLDDGMIRIFGNMTFNPKAYKISYTFNDLYEAYTMQDMLNYSIYRASLRSHASYDIAYQLEQELKSNIKVLGDHKILLIKHKISIKYAIHESEFIKRIVADE